MKTVFENGEIASGGKQKWNEQSIIIIIILANGQIAMIQRNTICTLFQFSVASMIPAFNEPIFFKWKKILHRDARSFFANLM